MRHVMHAKHFASKAGYARWLAYGHIHHKFHHKGTPIYIRGHLHHVVHIAKRRG